MYTVKKYVVYRCNHRGWAEVRYTSIVEKKEKLHHLAIQLCPACKINGVKISDKDEKIELLKRLPELSGNNIKKVLAAERIRNEFAFKHSKKFYKFKKIERAYDDAICSKTDADWWTRNYWYINELIETEVKKKLSKTRRWST